MPHRHGIASSPRSSQRRAWLSTNFQYAVGRYPQAPIPLVTLIVSGGDQAELRDVFSQRGISEWFDGGIFGSPDSKDEILARELANGNIDQPALFVSAPPTPPVAA